MAIYRYLALAANGVEGMRFLSAAEAMAMFFGLSPPSPAPISAALVADGASSAPIQAGAFAGPSGHRLRQVRQAAARRKRPKRAFT